MATLEDFRAAMKAAPPGPERLSVRSLLRDFVTDRGTREDYAQFVSNVDATDPALDSNWRETWKYSPEPDPCPPDGSKPAEFTFDDVFRVLRYRNGENDGQSWSVVAELLDGRFAWVDASCDYTGWG